MDVGKNIVLYVKNQISQFISFNFVYSFIYLNFLDGPVSVRESQIVTSKTLRKVVEVIAFRFPFTLYRMPQKGTPKLNQE